MPDVLEAMPFGATGREGQHRIAPVQGLDGGLLVDTEHRRVGRRVKVEANDVAHFLDELWIVRQPERLGPMRLQAEGLARSHWAM